MERIGADYDIHLVWNVKELINKVGPEKAIRELKKRCEAGAIIGCTIYKRLIEHWLMVAMRFEDKAGRGPAEEFMAAAGEDEWVQRVEKLHEEHPAGIPRSIQLDLIDEFNAELERRVGRKIPLEPGDASEEDIKESKKIAGQMARHEHVTPPKKEKEKPRPEPVRAAPEEPIIPVPKKAGTEVPRLDLMKEEIEERIRKMKAHALSEMATGKTKEEARRSALLEGFTRFDYLMFIEYIAMTTTVEQLEDVNYFVSQSQKLTSGEKQELSILISTKIRGAPTANFVRYTIYDFKDLIEKSIDIDFLKDICDEWVWQSKETMPYDKSDLCKLVSKRIKYLKGEGELKAGEKITDLPYEERRKLAKQIAATYPKCETEGPKITLDELDKMPKEKRIELAKKIASGEFEVREGADILTEPKDYSQWTFADFEGLLPGLESVEDLEELYEQVGASEVIADSDKETLRNLIKARIDVVKRFYTEWAAREAT